MSSLIFLYLSYHYRSDLLPCYESVPPGTSIRYIQTISNDVAQACVTPNLSCMSSFRARSLLVWPQIDYSIHISATLSCWTRRLLIAQHYAPCNMAGRIAVRYNLLFSLCGTLGSQKTPETWCHFNQLTLII
jgi:hypothetical protein